MPAMASRATAVRLVDSDAGSAQLAEQQLLDAVFFALSDPVRRAILERLGEESLLVSELATPFDISLQAVSRHIQVLVRAGLVQQERTGRISRCSIDVAPIFAAAVWINRYSKYWQAQFDTLAGWLDSIERRRVARKIAARGSRPRRRATPGRSKQRKEV
jgi:DNA-binding transcriptional ArsR family regulator